ncbi:MAG TPA: hypothetical protein QGF95_03475 [Candidatus Latescibacteria bacterium]|nr:hypothetical protein [Gemmatimonadaceae bacterium]MDP6018481.1 hypothetical protein [Candidatus Latescibacterota bacterium]HJP29596.1 hypothetical protein [Candidatus Latescibacterota bacterium]
MADTQPRNTVQICEDHVAVGEWSRDLGALVETSARVRQLLRRGDHAEARALIHSRTAEEQAALVTVDEDPEEVLSLTAMDENGRPGYLPAVVDHLPSETLAGLLAPAHARHLRFNTEVLRAMSPDTLRRAVDDTLDPVAFHGNRSRVSWEWLEAVTSLGDVDRIADLLHRIDVSALEDAFLERIDHFDMLAVVGGPYARISAFKVLSESAAGTLLPPIDDPETRQITQILHEATPDLLKQVLRAAWERAGAER